MRPLDDAPNTDELLPDLLAGTRDRTERAEVTDALDAIDGALTNNIRPLTGAAAMSDNNRVVATSEALYGVRKAGKRYRCDGHLNTDRHFIEPGTKYVASALPPHGEIGNERWWHNRLCAECCPIEYAAEVAS
jgi:hypothetical protein